MLLSALVNTEICMALFLTHAMCLVCCNVCNACFIATQTVKLEWQLSIFVEEGPRRGLGRGRLVVSAEIKSNIFIFSFKKKTLFRYCSIIVDCL